MATDMRNLPRSRTLLLGLLVASVSLAFLAQCLSIPQPVRVPAGLAADMVAPGLCCLLAWRPRWMTTPYLAVLTVPFSMACAALCGVVLDLLPGGVTGARMTLALMLLTMLAAAAAAGHFLSSQEDQTSVTAEDRSASVPPAVRRSRTSARRIGILATALCLTAAAATIAIVAASRVSVSTKFTSVGLVPGGSVAGQQRVAVEVQNDAGEATSYTVHLTFTGANQTSRPLAASAAAPSTLTRQVRVDAGSTWQMSVATSCSAEVHAVVTNPGPGAGSETADLRPQCPST
jgi:Protein of unknown function (DUF1616)